MDLPHYEDFAAWQQIRRESPIFFELLLHPRFGNACPRCNWSRLSGEDHDTRTPSHLPFEYRSQWQDRETPLGMLARRALERQHGVY